MKTFVLILIALVAVAASVDVDDVEKIVMFDEIDLTNVAGVFRVDGVENKKGFRFTDATTNLIVNQTVSKLFAEKTRRVNVFKVTSYLRTNSTTLRPLLSLSAGPTKPDDTTVAFDVKFSWVATKKDTVSAQVTLRESNGDGRTFTREIPVAKDTSRDKWLLFVAVVHIDEMLVRFRVDNHHYTHVATTVMRQLPLDGILRVAQESVKGDEDVQKVNRFEGDLQNLTIIFGESCDPVSPTMAPTTVPTTQSPPTACPVRTTCTAQDGTVYENGEEWKEDACTSCVCESGNSRCVQFCKLCKYEGEFRVEGTTWFDSSCQKCECMNGRVVCENTVRVMKTDSCQRSCSDSASGPCPHKPYTGCFCPYDQVLNNGVCRDRLSCPCEVKPGEIWQSGQSSFDQATSKFCKCSGGVLSCQSLQVG